MTPTKSFRELIVWQKSMAFVTHVYKLTNGFPKSEMYGLASQIQRASVSIPSNIAEGYLRKHKKEYAHFITIAFASGAEAETQLEIAKNLGYISTDAYDKAQVMLEEVLRMLNKLLQALTNS